jgi:lantibiotic modifying enzyme
MGLSHGTTGVAYALLELFSATGDARYRAAAERALEYERYWFDPRRGNWPDFRHDRKRQRRQRPQSFATFWCHGAPGIGLARLRAYEILNDERCKEEGSIALTTTYTMLQNGLNADAENFSLCHGLAGNAEILLYGCQMLGEEWAEKSDLVLKIARIGVKASKERGGAWRCGVDHGETPALMLGLAGIGYFYLRLYDPRIPSVLIPCRERYRPTIKAA